MKNFDVIILGSGLAGLTLARHLLLETDKRVLVLDKSNVLPRETTKRIKNFLSIVNTHYCLYFVIVRTLCYYLLDCLE